MGMILTRRYNVDRFGYLIPHRYGNLPMVGAVATYRPGEGRFGGAVAVEESTVNLLEANQRIPRSKTGWIAGVPNLAYPVSASLWDAEDISDFPYADSCISVTTSGTRLEGVGQVDIGGEKDTTYTLSAYVKFPAGTQFSMVIRSDAGSMVSKSTGPLIGTGEWQRISVTITSLPDTDPVWRWGVLTDNAVTFYVTAVQLEAKPFATSFVDGTRAAGRLEYPQSIWNHATGTFAAWVKTPTDVSTDRVLTLQWAMDDLTPNSRFGIRMNTSGRFWVSYGSADTLTTADSYNDGEWHHVVLTWVDGTADIHLYVDGERVVSASEPISVSNPGGRYRGVIPIGHRGFTYNDQWWNGLIDELLILPYAASEEEILSWYEAQGPLPPHPQALLQWDRQTVRPAQMVKL